MGTDCLLEAVRAEALQGDRARVGSSDTYGAVSVDQLPLREDAPTRARNPYAASKAAAEVIALQYARASWCRVIATRSFNHTGPAKAPPSRCVVRASGRGHQGQAARTGA